ncbi:MAG TPA: helix-turn-helix domain-containing protein [Flavobacteriaceae bacterium]|nr:helix-turn-helix domain-containing protein [Flavobacteriaceae bacterium]
MKPTEIKGLRLKLKLSQTEFGELIGVSLRSVQAYEKGNTKPSADTLMKLLGLFNDNMQGDSQFETIETKSGNKYIALPDGTFDVEVKLIPFSAYASYVESFETGQVDIDFGSVVFNVDHAGKGNYKAFIVRGDSMNGGKIDDTKDGAKVLGRELQKHHWKDGFRKSEYGWIILSKQNIFHKDITDLNPEDGTITCHSRNPSPEYSDFELKLNDCYQIFKVIKRIF